MVISSPTSKGELSLAQWQDDRAQAHPLGDQDVIEIAGTKMAFVLQG